MQKGVQTETSVRRRPAAARRQSRVRERPGTDEQVKLTPIVVVLGMHRSGSSAIARGLQTLGVDLGDNLMPPATGNNEKGFFEDLDLYRLNEALLKKLSSAWHQLGAIDSAPMSGGAFAAERRKASALLAKKLGSGVFGFKDPRTAVLLPFWQCVFEDLELDPRYVITVRNPIESALSLNERDGFHLSKGVALWAKHIVEAVRNTHGKRRVFVAYDRMLSEPAVQLRRIARMLDLPAPDGQLLRDYTDDFLAPALRHNRVSAGELKRSGLASPFVIDLYTTLAQLAASDEDAALDQAAWRLIESGYQELAPILQYADELHRRGDEATARAQDLEKQLNRANAERAELVAATEKAVQERQAEAAELAKLSQKLEDVQKNGAAEIARLSEALSAEQAKRAETIAERNVLATQAHARAEANEQANAEIARLRQELEHAQKNGAAEIARLSEALSAEQAKRAETIAERNVLATQAHARAEANEQANAEIAHLRQELEHAQKNAAAEIARLSADLGAEQARLADIAAERNGLVAQLEAQVQAHESANIELARLTEALASAQARVAQAAAERDGLAKQLQLQSDAHERANVEIARLTENLAAAQAQEANTAAQRDDLILQVEVHARARENANAEIDRLTGALESAQARTADAAAERDSLVCQLQAQAQAHEQTNAEIAPLSKALAAAANDATERDRLIAELTTKAQANDQAAAEIAQLRAKCESLARSLAHEQSKAVDAARDRDCIVEQLVVPTHAYEQAATGLHNTERMQAESAERNAELSRSLARLSQDLAEAAQQRAQLEQLLKDHRRDLLLARSALTATRRSTSWRLTAPLRAVSTVARVSFTNVRSIGAPVARSAWHMLPMPPERRGRLAARLFSTAPGLFAWSGAYKAWQATQSGESHGAEFNPPQRKLGVLEHPR